MYLKELAWQLWTSRKTTLVVLGVLALANLLLFVVLQQVVVPQVSEREEYFMTRQSEVRQSLRQRGGTANTPEQRFIQARQGLDEFQSLIPEHREFTGLIEELLDLADQSRLNITRISYAHKLDEKSGLMAYTLSFSVAGEYIQVKKFIHLIEQSQRVMSITQIGLRGMEDQPESGLRNQVNLNLQVETFFKAEGTAS